MQSSTNTQQTIKFHRFEAPFFSYRSLITNEDKTKLQQKFYETQIRNGDKDDDHDDDERIFKFELSCLCLCVNERGDKYKMCASLLWVLQGKNVPSSHRFLVFKGIRCDGGEHIFASDTHIFSCFKFLFIITRRRRQRRQIMMERRWR